MRNHEPTTRTRHVHFDGTQNFRDLGGLATRAGVTKFGVAYRSDRLSNLTPNDGNRLNKLGIATIIDLRSRDERQRAPNRLGHNYAGRELSRAFLPSYTSKIFEAINSGAADGDTAHAMMLNQYASLALDHVRDYREVLSAILSPQATPVVFHCTSGKDRTGMIAAILLLALGATEEVIVHDYELTQDRIERVDLFDPGARPEAVDAVMAARPAYLQAALAAMRREFGSTDNYLQQGVGLSREEREQLITLLIDD